MNALTRTLLAAAGSTLLAIAIVIAVTLWLTT